MSIRRPSLWAGSSPFLLVVAVLVGVVLPEAMYRLSAPFGVGLVAAPVVVGVIALRPLLGIYAALLAIPLETAGTSFASSNITPTKGLLILTAMSILPRLVLGDRRVHLHAVHRWFLLLLAVSISGLAFAPDKHAVVVITGNALAYLIISIYVSSLDARRITQLVTVLVLSGAVVGALTVLTSGAVAGNAASDSARAQLGFDSPNILAFYLVLTLGPTLAMLAGETRGWRRLLAAAATPLVIVGLVLTQSRTGIVGAVLVVIVLLWSSRFRRIAAAAGVVLLFVVALDFGTIMRSPVITSVKQRLTAISSVSGVQQDPRSLIWRTTPQIIADHPILGVGEGNFPAISPRYGLLAFDLTPIDHAHNLFLTVAAELGLVGLSVFLGFLFFLARAIWRALKRSVADELLALGVAASFTAMLLISLGDYPARAPTVLATMLLLVGVVLGLGREAHRG